VGADPAIVRAVQRLREKTGVPIERAILFGSRARGDAGPHSDVDLLLVSSSFAGKSASQRAAPLHLAWDLDLPVDFLCYSPEEFERLRRRITIVRIALQEGLEIGM
jgi:hypothetical protein